MRQKLLSEKKEHPLPKKSGVPIGLVAGACYVPEWNQISVHAFRWVYSGVKQGVKRMERVGLSV